MRWDGPNTRLELKTFEQAQSFNFYLGNVGVAGGGISALRGQPNVQGSTDGCLLFNLSRATLSSPDHLRQPLETT